MANIGGETRPKELTVTTPSTVQVALRIKPTIILDSTITHSIASASHEPSLKGHHHPIVTPSNEVPNQVIFKTLEKSKGDAEEEGKSEDKQVYSFDHVFGEECTQQEFYESAIEGLIEKFLDGYNVTILTYGKTSSGKSYTLGTTPSSISTSSNDSDTSSTSCIIDHQSGIIPRSMNSLFALIENSEKYKSNKISLKVSYVEVVNEDLIDLLDPPIYLFNGEDDKMGGMGIGNGRDSSTGHRIGEMSTNEIGMYFGHNEIPYLKPLVLIREDAKGNIHWSGLQEIGVNNAKEVMEHLTRGIESRHKNCSDVSTSIASRSHTIFSVTMTRQKFIPSVSSLTSHTASSLSRRSSTTPHSSGSRPSSRMSVSTSNSRPSSRAGNESRPTSRASSGLGIRNDESGERTTITSKLWFVELSGNEKSSSSNGDLTTSEVVRPNPGLLSLENIISILGTSKLNSSTKSTSHHDIPVHITPNRDNRVVPYRDTKLTRLLQDSFGGSAHTLMIACVSPEECDRAVTLDTLRYASLTRNIKNIPSKNVKVTSVGNARRNSLTRETAASSARRAAVGNDRRSTTPTNGHIRKKSMDVKHSENDEPGWHDVKNLQSTVIKLRAENNALKIALTAVEKHGQANGRSTPVSGRTPGRSTPTLIPGRSTPTKPRSPLATYSSSKNSLSQQNQQYYAEQLEEIESQYLQLRQSYAELSLKYGQASAELALYQDNREITSAYPTSPFGVSSRD
ncbi:149_t:CDS:2, partial [Acaulospora morrowiae]